MPDFRFFESRGPLTLAEVIALTGALAPASVDASHRVFGCASLEDADAQSAAFFADPRYKANLAKSAAGFIFLRANQATLAPPSAISLVVKSPQAAWSRLAAAVYRVRGIDAGQALDPSAILEADVSLAPGAVVGPGVEIGRGTRIGANAVIGAGVKIGRGCDVGPGAVIQCALIGDRVRIGPNAVIGEAGFGVALDDGGPVDVPQLGRVILQDGVGVGASACIDRGALDDTVVGENTKIDNLVQIAHNVKIGRGCLLAAHTGLSGSVVVGDGAMFGGRAGVTDHNVIGAGAIIAAGAAVFRSVPAGETWSGYPARPLKRFLREVAWLAKATGGGSGRE